MARVSRRRQAPPQRRKFVWARRRGSLIVASTDGIKIDLLDNFQAEYGAQLLGATVMRIKGVAFAKGETGTGTLVAAVRVFTESASIADEEGPLEAEHADWMAWMPSLLDGEAGTSTIYNDHRYEVDVKSARRLEELGQGLMLAVQHDVVTTALTYDFDFSIGLKLP